MWPILCETYDQVDDLGRQNLGEEAFQKHNITHAWVSAHVQPLWLQVAAVTWCWFGWSGHCLTFGYGEFLKSALAGSVRAEFVDQIFDEEVGLSKSHFLYCLITHICMADV